MICSASMRLVYFTLKSLLLIYYTSISQTDFFMHFSTIRSARNATTTVIIIITTSIHIGVIASMVSPYAFPISAACSAISLVRSVHITIVRPNGIKAKRRYEIRTPAILLLPIARRITSVIIPISNINPLPQETQKVFRHRTFAILLSNTDTEYPQTQKKLAKHIPRKTDEYIPDKVMHI